MVELELQCSSCLGGVLTWRHGGEHHVALKWLKGSAGARQMSLKTKNQVVLAAFWVFIIRPLHLNVETAPQVVKIPRVKLISAELRLNGKLSSRRQSGPPHLASLMSCVDISYIISLHDTGVSVGIVLWCPHQLNVCVLPGDQHYSWQDWNLWVEINQVYHRT